MINKNSKNIFILFLTLFLLFSLFQPAQAVTKRIGQVATVEVSCSDANGNLSQCNVTWPCTRSCPASGYSGSCSCEYTCLGPGTFNTCGQAKDDKGEANTKCLDSIICNGAPLKPVPPESHPSGEDWDHCLFWGVSLPTFYWVYSDPENDLQVGYEIRIDDDTDFSVIDGDEYLCEGEVCSGGASVSFTPMTVAWSDWMDWNTPYWWIVRVQDSLNNWSPWSDANQFVTPLHAYPSPYFTHDPLTPTAGEEVTFLDSSVCYNPGGSSYSCGDNAENRYQWDFEDDLVIDCDSDIDSFCLGNATTTYDQDGDYVVRLQVTDSLGTCETTGDTPIFTTLPLPEYKEVPPVTLFKKMIALAFKFFNNLF